MPKNVFRISERWGKYRLSKPDTAQSKNHDNPVEADLLLWWEDYYLPIFEYILPKMGDLDGKNILELGTGTGGTATMLAKRGASVVGIDLLQFRLVEAQQRTVKHDVAADVDFALMDATQLAFPDNTFDFIISKSVLVFTEHSRTAEECKRVLKSGGKAIFIENMRNHPAVWLYRRLFLKYSRELKYFSIGDIEKIGKEFEEMDHREFHLFSLCALFWKKCISVPIFFRWTYRFLKKIDELIFRLMPIFKRYCWISAMVFRK